MAVSTDDDNSTNDAYRTLPFTHLSSLVPGAVHHLIYHRSLSQDQRPNPFGRVQLVPRDCEQVHTEVPKADIRFAHALRRISVKDNVGIARFRGLAEALDWLDRAHLVIGVHDGD